MNFTKFAAAVAVMSSLGMNSAGAQAIGSAAFLSQAATYEINALALPSVVVSAQAQISPTAPDAAHDATTVPIDQMLRRSSGPGAPRIGLSPTATEAEQNATTVSREETRRRPGVSPAPRSGANPSAPD